MKIKSRNVGISTISNHIIFALLIAQTIYDKFGCELIITSLQDSVHSNGSKHYSGNAVDLRIKNIPKPMQVLVFNALKAALPIGFDCILESDHIHIEWDPK